MSETLIRFSGLCKAFDGNAVRALSGVSGEIRKGEVVVVIGPSGSGKSTFLRCLNLLDRPTEGSILFGGEDIAGRAVLKRYLLILLTIWTKINLKLQ